MSVDYSKHVSNKNTPQTEPAKPTQAQNNAGGYSFIVDDWVRLQRFLILGAEGGTYYVKERELTKDNAAVVGRCLDSDPTRTVKTIVEVSDAGRAPKNDAAIFALALAASHTSQVAKKAAYEALPKVCRIGTHLFQFVAACDAMRGWGSGLRKAVANWYTSKSPDQLAYQVTKYGQRNGWSHRDVLRTVHATAGGVSGQELVLRWAATGQLTGERTVTRGKDDKAKTVTYAAVDPMLTPKSILALEALKKATTETEVVDLIDRYADKAPRELVPTQFLTSAKVWGALLPHTPLTALLRNLGNMSKCGLIVPLSEAERDVCARFRDKDVIKKARLHPLNVLVALKTYASGRGVKGGGEWKVSQPVVDALQDAFYLAFDAVEPTGKRIAFGLDVSGSMGSAIAGMPISSCEAVTALSLVSARTEPYTFTGLFTSVFEEAPFGKTTRLDDAMRKTASRNFGSTDCALLMKECVKRHITVDAFVVMTDSETYVGSPHPFQALKAYRDIMGVPAKLIVVATTSTGFTIADASDAGMLDVVGFDTNVPAVMSDFIRQ